MNITSYTIIFAVVFSLVNSRSDLLNNRGYLIDKSKRGHLLTLNDLTPSQHYNLSDGPIGLVLSKAGHLNRSAEHQWTANTVVLTVLRIETINSPVTIQITLHLWDELDPTSTDDIFTNEKSMWAKIRIWNRPGSVVFRFAASISMRYNDIITVYQLEAGGDDHFSVDTITGEVIIKDRYKHTEGQVFKLAVSARCEGVVYQRGSTNTEVLSIKVDNLGPKFNTQGLNYFLINSPETKEIGDLIHRCGARSFYHLPITYEIIPDQNRYPVTTLPVRIDSNTGDLFLTFSQTFRNLPNVYRFRLKATESMSGYISEIPVILNIAPVNANAPVFPINVYVTPKPVSEATPIGEVIMRLSVYDADGGKFSEMTFTCTEAVFEIVTDINDKRTGLLKVKSRLDYDFIPRHTYVFIVTATDGGGRQGHTEVRIEMENVNDELPTMYPGQQIVRLKTLSRANMFVAMVQAYDPDGDSFTFELVNTKYSEYFDVDPNSGLLRLSRDLPRISGLPDFYLEFKLTDGNTCCDKKVQNKNYNNGTLLVKFIGVNHPPYFKECPQKGTISIPEKSPNNKLVLTLIGEDIDAGENGATFMALVYKHNQYKKYFRIENHGNEGRIYVDLKDGYTIDRENPSERALKNNNKIYEPLLVSITDRATVSLEPKKHLTSYCFLYIEITDINDEVPVFFRDSTGYSINVPRINGEQSPMQIMAFDKDSGRNSEISYSIEVEQSGCQGCVSIDVNTGWITLHNQINNYKSNEQIVDDPNSAIVRVTVMAKDHGPNGGHNSTDTIKIIIVDPALKQLLPPIWKDENGNELGKNNPATITLTEVNLIEKAFTFIAIPSKTDGIIKCTVLSQFPTDDGDNFLAKNGSSCVMSILAQDLDYETEQWYYISMRASSSQKIYRDLFIRVQIQDINDEKPEFLGTSPNGYYIASVSETVIKGEQILQIKALDLDINPVYNKITYRFADDCSLCKNFTMDNKGRILAGYPNSSQTDIYKYMGNTEQFLKVIATDGTYTMEVEISITYEGFSTEAPVFDRQAYILKMDEKATFETLVNTITATVIKRQDDLQYYIISGNQQHSFGVHRLNGSIFTMRYLIYEDIQEIKLTYRAFHGTDNYKDVDITISILKSNRMDPVLPEQKLYVYDAYTEMSEVINPLEIMIIKKIANTNNVESFIKGVHAVDGTLTLSNNNDNRISLTKTLDRDFPAGHSDWLLNFGIGNANDAAYGVLRISPTDINDNPPHFDETCCVYGDFSENLPKFSTIFSLKVVDYDTPANANSKYEMIGSSQNSIGQNLFSLDNNGNDWVIKTGENFNFEASTTNFFVNVKAWNHPASSPPTIAYQTIYLTLKDTNDNPLRFAETSYQIDITELWSRDDIVIRVSADDLDIDDLIDYTIDAGNDDNYFYVNNVRSTRTAVIKLNKMIDVGGLPSKTFELTLRATTPDTSKDTSTCIVIVKVIDANNNAPVMTVIDHYKFISINEGTAFNQNIFSFVTDADYGINKEIIYSINYMMSERATKHYTISPSTGHLQISSLVDRDTMLLDTVVLRIVATDKGSPPQHSYFDLQITIKDINDETPVIDTKSVDISSQLGSRATLKLYDPDTEGTYSIKCVDGDCSYFTFSNVRSTSAVIKVVKALDEGVTYSLKLTITDGQNTNTPNGQVIMIRCISTSNRYQHSTTTKTFQVFNYQGTLNDQIIGSVGFKDRDYKFDEGKRYELTTSMSYFKVNQNNGQITIEEATPHGSYQLNIKITDGSFNAVTSIVRVTVTYIDDSIINNSSSIRIKGMSKKHFIQTDADGNSKLSSLRESLALALGTLTTNVIVFSLDNVVVSGRITALDVTWAAHGSPYYSTEKLNTVANDNKAKISTKLNIDITSIPINPCADSNCMDGCVNTIKNGGSVTTDSSDASFVGVKTSYRAVCGCMTSITTGCGSCLNGGVCMKSWYGERCSCPNGYRGPRCQALTVGLDGTGYVIYGSMQSCRVGVTSIDLSTTDSDALVFYIGPKDSSSSFEFASLEISNGRPVYKLSLDPSHKNILTLQSSSLILINDGKLHTIEIWKNEMEVRMTIDHCLSAKTTESIGSTTTGRSTCEVRGTITDNTYLYSDFSSYSLEIGGRKGNNNFKSFKGCIKNLRHNSILYDLNIGKTRISTGASNTCSEDSCYTCETSQSKVCSLEGKCSCKPGLMGPDCESEAPVIDITSANSFLQWKQPQNSLIGNQSDTHSVSLMFRSRQPNGVLFTIQSFSTLEQFIIEIMDKHLVLKVDLGGGDNTLSLSQVMVSDGDWHSVSAVNYANQITLVLDNGEGQKYATMQDINNEFSVLYVGTDNGDLYAGAKVTNQKYTPPTSTNALKNSCIKDIRVNGILLSFPSLKSADSTIVTQREILTQCTSDGCRNDTRVCPEGQICYDTWRLHQCICKPGYKLSSGICVLITDCSIQRCYNGGYCMIFRGKWRCNCPLPWIGRDCQQKPTDPKKRKAAMGTGTIIIIILALLVILIIVLVLALIYRRRVPKKLLIYEDNGDIREALGYYDEEGAGEEDVTGYDLSRLQKPIIDNYSPITKTEKVNEAFQGDSIPEVNKPRIGDIINERLLKPDTADDDDALDIDSLRQYDNEGNNSSVGSLSSLSSSSASDIDFNFLNDYGPKFKHLADLYGINE